jgi:hypothetical protein
LKNYFEFLKKLIQDNASWSEQFGEWNLRSIAYTGNSIKNKETKKQNQVLYRKISKRYLFNIDF